MKSGKMKTLKRCWQANRRRFQTFPLRPAERKLVSSEETAQFFLLMQSGLGFSHALECAFSRSDQLRQKLEAGLSFEQVLLSSAGRQGKNAAYLMGFMPLESALKAQKTIEQTSAELIRKLSSKAAYPVFLMAFCTVLIYVFASMVLPSMEEYAGNSIVFVFQILKSLVLLFWAVSGIILFLLLQTGRNKMVTEWMMKVSVIRQTASIQTASLFRILLELDLPTSQSLQIAAGLPECPLASSTARRWLKKIRKGIPFEAVVLEDSSLDSLLIRFMKVGLKSSSLPEMLEAYEKTAFLHLEKEVRQISQLLQAFAYGFTASLVLSVSQLLMEPLSILEQI